MWSWSHSPLFGETLVDLYLVVTDQFGCFCIEHLQRNTKVKQISEQQLHLVKEQTDVITFSITVWESGLKGELGAGEEGINMGQRLHHHLQTQVSIFPD